MFSLKVKKIALYMSGLKQTQSITIFLHTTQSLMGFLLNMAALPLKRSIS